MTLTTLTPSALAERAQNTADRPEEWIHRVRLSTDGRWYERLHADRDCEIWLISWLPGQATGFHDHGGSSGAFAVALGELTEHRPSSHPASRTDASPGGRPVRAGQAEVGGRLVQTGQAHGFGPGYVHDVRNESLAPAVSVHVYSPPLSAMQRYDLDDEGRLVPVAIEQAEEW